MFATVEELTPLYLAGRQKVHAEITSIRAKHRADRIRQQQITPGPRNSKFKPEQYARRQLDLIGKKLREAAEKGNRSIVHEVRSDREVVADLIEKALTEAGYTVILRVKLVAQGYRFQITWASPAQERHEMFMASCGFPIGVHSNPTELV